MRLIKSSGQLILLTVLFLFTGSIGYAQCTCTGNVVVNPSFENGTTGWNWSGGNFNAGTGAVICGIKSGDFQITNTAANWVSQTIGTDLAPGTVINASVYAGTHNNTFNHYVSVDFFDANWNWLSNAAVEVNKVLANAPAGPQLYTLTATVPAGAKYTNVGFTGNGDWIKTDQWCVTLTPPSGGGSIGDRVWLDADGDGIQDASETSGITGVTVQLKNAGGTVIATTTTNASGNYLFTGLAAGNYTVVFPTSISGAVVTPQNVGSDDNVDSDPSQSTGATALISLTANQHITNVDAGYCPTTLELGNRVWYDANNDGVNAGENGIPGITVYLYKDDNNDNAADGVSIASTVTDANGYYSFTNLGPGHYIVGVVTPAGYMSSAVNGGDPDNNINLDDNGQVTVGNETRGLAITLVAGTEPLIDGNTNNNSNITYDFGLLPDCSCTNSAGNLLLNASFENGTTSWNWSGGTLSTGTGYIACGAANGFNNWASGTAKVWQDITVAAGSGISFKGFAGVHTPGLTCSPKLSLIFLNASNQIISQTDVAVTRDVDIYFGQLEQYSINATAPAGTVKVRVQSAINCNTMKLDAFCLTATSPLSLGDRIFHDLNDNGTREASETGINGVTVNLYADANNDNVADGAAIQTTSSDVNGSYRFNNLPAGNYIVGVVVPDGYRSSTLNGVDPDNNTDLDDNGNNTVVSGEVRGNAITLTAGAETLESGNYNHTYDFGFAGTGRIGDFVWKDLDADGVQDSGEPGLAGVTVTLTHPNGTTITVVTDANGAYSFNNLAPGTYNLAFSTPSGYVAVSADKGGDDSKDSDPVNGIVSNLVLAPAQTNLTVDAGFYQPASIGNFVWNDLNGNGLQDAGEPGIAGVTVALTGTDGAGNAVSLSVTTGANGSYTFNNLVPGIYNVNFTTLSGYNAATSNAGGNDAIDSDPVSGAVNGIMLISGTTNDTVDAGFVQTLPIVLSGNIFYDDNGMTDGLVNGTTTIPSGINAVLYDPVLNQVIAVQPVPGHGQPGAGMFSFNVTSYSTYRVMITTANPAPGAAPPVTSVLPASFRSTGEIVGTGAGNDGTVDGKSVVITTTNINVTNVNFAIKRVVLIVVD